MIFQPLHHDIDKPQRFTWPFNYEPHPLSMLAAKDLQQRLADNEQIADEISHGKMFGVMVAENTDGQTGYISAYSGLLSGRNDYPGFVPAIYDILSPDGTFKQGEEQLNELNRKISDLEQSDELKSLKSALAELEEECSRELEKYRQMMRQSKDERDKKRKECHISKEEEQRLIAESQYQKAELKRRQRHYNEMLDKKRNALETFSPSISLFKEQRRQKSEDLQRWVFSQYKVMNAKGEEKSILEIFETSIHRLPPSGTGECAAPKLLDYAYRNNLKPVCMAEFWWGASPIGEIRHHLAYYPACRGKCLPLLTYMLEGLPTDNDPNETGKDKRKPLQTIYEDEYLCIISKPSGMPSVPGKINAESVYDIVRASYPDATGPLMVHRLDMATSGLMLIAKSKEIHKSLQSLFLSHGIKKRYAALLDGDVTCNHGYIRLPLRPDPLDRPRQTVDYSNGKEAITEYKLIGKCQVSALSGVIDTSNAKSETASFVRLYPHTGRTHQLRVHCAHKEGLGCPIIGDTLYGYGGKRLCLHAERLEFVHPVTGKVVIAEKAADFIENTVFHCKD